MSRRREELVACRETAGYTQESLAATIRVDRSTIVRWERGEKIAPWLRRRLADAFGLTLQELSVLVDAHTVQDHAAPDGADGATSANFQPPRRPPGQQTPRLKDVEGLRIAICGSRTAETDNALIDAVVSVLARFVMVSGLRVNHGPVGVGIEVITHIADRYRPADLTMTPSLFGRQNVVRDVEYALGDRRRQRHRR